MGRFVPILASFTLSACAAGHGLTGTPVNIEPVLPETPETYQAETVAQAPLMSNWLNQFDDPRLVELVEEALLANPNILSNEALIRAAEQNARAVFGRSLPSIGFNFNNGFSTTFSSQALGGGVVVDGRFDQPSFANSFQVSWELDLWGRVRAANQAAKSDYIATQADLSAAQLSLASQVAISWINLNAALEQERIGVATVTSRKSVLELTERRFGRGLSTALDVRTARSQLATAEAQVAAQTQNRNEATRAVEVLLGRYPATALEAPAILPALAPIQSPGSPADLLTRRPDIAAIEARLEAAGFRAEAARLAIFPSLNLTSNISNSSSIEFPDIFDPQRISANIFASLTQSVWNGGAVKADKRAALANAEAISYNYATTALTAWREVEDALDADRLLAVQEAAQQRALEESILAEDLATRQYQNGLVTIFNLLTSQTNRLTAEGSLIQAKAARAVNRVNYHMALGGGFTSSPQTQEQASTTAGAP